MQSVSSRIWTRVAVSISSDDNHYTTGTTYDNTTNIATINMLQNKCNKHAWKDTDNHFLII